MSQELKDGLIELRAMKAVGAVEVYTEKTIHIHQSGSCLCGFEGKVYGVTGKDPAKMPRCGKCQKKLDALLAEQKKTELRNYWRKPEYGGIKTAAQPKPKLRPKVSQPSLPDELLPTGTGERRGVWRNESRQSENHT